MPQLDLLTFFSNICVFYFLVSCTFLFFYEFIFSSYLLKIKLILRYNYYNLIR